jgi:hypothetical protein
VTKTDLETNKTYQPGIVKIIYSKVAKATLQPVHSILICKTMEPAMVSAQFAVMYQVKQHLSFEGLIVKTPETHQRCMEVTLDKKK